MKSLTNPLGLYLHIPFCEGKCAYCDFYSVFSGDELKADYTKTLIKEIQQWGGKISRPIDTIYLGGGTPSLLADRLPDIINAVKEAFTVKDNAEITLEINPSGNIKNILEFARKAGINRLSLGVQSGDDDELLTLGRKHTVQDTVNAVTIAREMGFDNISLDIMLGLPNSNSISLQKSLEFILKLNPEHISAYILKIEENTVFFKKRDQLGLPDDDNVSDQYLQMCDFFKAGGYNHYEISNFAKENYHSRHNTKYWELNDYLGIGPSAHSCLDGKRFYYPRDIKAFIKGNEPIFDCNVDLSEEYIILGLRLSQGIELSQFEKFKIPLTDKFLKKCELLKQNGLLNITQNRISLTDKGMLISNSILITLMECLE